MAMAYDLVTDTLPRPDRAPRDDPLNSTASLADRRPATPSSSHKMEPPETLGRFDLLFRRRERRASLRIDMGHRRGLDRNLSRRAPRRGVQRDGSLMTRSTRPSADRPQDVADGPALPRRHACPGRRRAVSIRQRGTADGHHGRDLPVPGHGELGGDPGTAERPELASGEPERLGLQPQVSDGLPQVIQRELAPGWPSARWRPAPTARSCRPDAAQAARARRPRAGRR